MPSNRWIARQQLKEAANQLSRAADILGNDVEHGGLTSIIITNLATMALNIHARIRE